MSIESEIIDNLADVGLEMFVGIRDSKGEILSLESVYAQSDILRFLLESKAVHLGGRNGND